MSAELEALRAALRSVNAVAIERGDKDGVCDQIDNDGEPYQSEWLANLLKQAASPANTEAATGEREALTEKDIIRMASRRALFVDQGRAFSYTKQGIEAFARDIERHLNGEKP
jgi:uncharacterized protein (DUF2336 family)